MKILIQHRFQLEALPDAEFEDVRATLKAYSVYNRYHEGGHPGTKVIRIEVQKVTLDEEDMQIFLDTISNYFNPENAIFRELHLIYCHGMTFELAFLPPGPSFHPHFTVD